MPTTTGQLRERVSLQSQARTPDTGGGADVSWATYATLWARVTPKGAREAYSAHQLAPVYTHQVVVRRRTDVTSAHRVLWGSRQLAVVGVEQDEPHAMTTLYCKEAQVG